VFDVDGYYDGDDKYCDSITNYDIDYAHSNKDYTVKCDLQMYKSRDVLTERISCCGSTRDISLEP
jgi:hypothetical protein